MTVKSIASTNVIICSKNIAATILYSTSSGKIIEIFENIVISSITDPRLTNYGVSEHTTVSPMVILPGLVDSHVHLNEPGRTEWEGFATGTQAAICGGVTTIIDMPLNAVPPTTTVENLNIKLNAAHNQLWCDVGFWGGLVPDNLHDLIPLVNAGVRGFKGFLIHSGVDEFPSIDENYIMEAMDILGNEKTMMMFHAEMENNDSKEPKEFIEKQLEHNNQNSSSALCQNSSKGPTSEYDPFAYSSFLKSRPDSFETDAINLIIKCMKMVMEQKEKEIPAVHIVHLASQHAISLINEAHNRGLPLTAETCFHYLCIASETIADRATYLKCCPPIREESNRVALWNALRAGTITSVVSDHSPCTPELKLLEKGDFFQASLGWYFIGGVRLIIIVHKRSFSC